MNLSAGDRIGVYTIIGPLGDGGMGVVYKARDTRLQRTVAIKLLREDRLDDAEYVQRLEREARVLAGLNHPHICVLHDVGQHHGAHYLVMEFLEGYSLAQRLRNGPLPTRQALELARDIAAGLAAAHAQGLVHRDLKPANIILAKTGAKLVDFGLAKPFAPNLRLTDGTEPTHSGVTQPWQIVGTLPYMAPERLQGRPVDARADIFAFGAVLYEMLAGRPAFTGDNQAAIAASVLTCDPPPVAGVSVALDRVIRRCLAKVADDRWSGIGDVAEALALATDPFASARPAVTKRSALRWSLVAILIAVLLAGVAYSLGVHLVSTPRPVVVLMDSTLAERVYDPATRQDGGTNSDDITDTLRDLPLELHKETTSALWHREDQVVQQHPALVMMHLSSFAQPSVNPDAPLQTQAEERTRSFLGFAGLANSRTQFIVYTRGFGTEPEKEVWVNETVQRYPALRGRLRMVTIPGGENATFRDPATRRLVRREVEAMLGYTAR